jgi:hypothetical protein
MEGSEYEGLMALASRGTSLVETLRLKAGAWRDLNMDALLRRRCTHAGDLRFPDFGSDYEELTVACWNRLFGKEPPPRVIETIRESAGPLRGGSKRPARRTR